MGLYDNISGITVLIYIFMFLIILNAKKSNIRDVFLVLIAISILWTGGSLLMRLQAIPDYKVWYHVSLLGIFLMPVVYFRFIMEYTRSVKYSYMYIYGGIMVFVFTLNLFTGLFIPPPVLKLVNGAEVMVYQEIGKLIYFLYVIVGLMIVHMLYWFYIAVKRDRSLRRISIPITIGIVALFTGNLLLLIPAFQSFPVDILGGLVNAFALFFALTMRSPFKLKMLMSESVGYATCLLLGFSTLYILNPSIIVLLTRTNISEDTWTVWYLGIFSGLLVIYITAWRMIIVGIFIKEEEEIASLLNHFSATVTTSLDSTHIFELSLVTIEKVVGPCGIHFTLEKDEEFVFSKNDDLTASLDSVRSDSPLVLRLSKSSEYIDLKEFRLENEYQTMVDSEQNVLTSLSISHVFGIKDEEGIHGILFISDATLKKELKHQDALRIQSICTMVAIALKNAASYEQAVIASITDNLTGLYNRKHFYTEINQRMMNAKDKSLALIMINLDDFKLYNQLFGVKKADTALVVVSSLLKDIIGNEGSVYRYSGKEFAILLPSYNVAKSLNLVERITKKIDQYAQAEVMGLEKRITASIGICVYPYGANHVNELIENVQQAIYQIKRSGKNNVTVFDTFVEQDQQSKERSFSAIYNEHKSTIYALTAAIDAKDHYTFSHSENVAKYAVAFAVKLNLNTEIIENIRQAALLHDIGKIAIPEDVLNKPGKLTKDEYKFMQGHVDASIDIIRHLPSLDYVIPAVLGHHERYDGTGYPRRISGEDIPLTARILCIADSVDAMLSKRTYKEEKTIEEVIEILRNESGKQFDPKLVQLFTEHFVTIIE